MSDAEFLIEQTVIIPADHRLRLDFEVPSEIPTGSTARIELFWSPSKETTHNLDAALEKIWKLCDGSSLTVDSFLEMRRRDKELEESQYRRFFYRSGDDN
jgi:hypothetical protein